MTGEKNRFQTHEQLWKIDDSELSTPKHDELVLQLLYKQNAKKLIYLCFPHAFNDLDSFEEIDDSRIEVESELPITTKNDYIIGYIDIAISCRRGDFPPLILFVEVKPKIKSFGETLRQIRTYKNYRNTPCIIYSPDTTFKNAFDSQKIPIITPSDLKLYS